MGLCALCQDINFEDLPPLPSHYRGYHKPYGDLVAFLSLELKEARKAGDEAETAEKFSQPLGLPHHQSVEALRAAAKYCSICKLIELAVTETQTQLAEARKDEIFSYYSKQRRFPDYRLWLAKRKDECDGFMVLSSSDPVEVYVITCVGFCTKDENEPLSSAIPGRTIEADAGSEKTLKAALAWVQECDKSHTSCAVDGSELPLRVLDVASDGAPSRLRLYESQGTSGKYVALSHVWGDSGHFTTTLSNVAQHKTGILLELLPKTFQDAVTLTRKLGIRYLWIDSLCICQDDGPDWERESAKMASIYSNAYVTIAATGAASNAQGFLATRSTPEYSDFDYTTKDGKTGHIYAFPISPLKAAHKRSYSQFDDQPLRKRGWALQERVLARRTLHFATDQLFFECNKHFVAEDGFRSQGLLHTLQEIHHPASAPAGFSDYERDIVTKSHRGPWLWYNLLYDYCSRELTKPSDKLPALSGIARAFEERTGDRYVAGLWRSTLMEGILWQAIGTYRGATKAPVEYRAPSWSWASFDGPFGNAGLGRDVLGRKITNVDVATILDCEVEPRGENPYGEVKSGWIKIKAPLEALEPGTEKDPGWEKLPHRVALRMRTKKGNAQGSHCTFDTISDDEALQMSLHVLILVVAEPEPGSKAEETRRFYHSLIVTPVDGREHCYRRVGKMITDDDILGKCDWMDDKTKMVTITLV